MSTPTKKSIRISRRIPFSAERVFDAWLNPESASKWLFAAAEGKMVRAEIDPKVGGRFVFTDLRETGEAEHVGEYLEISRPRRLVFLFGLPKHSEEREKVTAEFSPFEGGCEVTITHETAPEYSARAKFGWTEMVQRLAAEIGDQSAARNLEPGKFTGPGEVRLVRMLPGPIERVWEYLTDSEKRGRWLAGGPMELRKGGRVELNFRHSNLTDEEPPERYREVHHTGFGMIGEITRCEPPRLLSYSWEGDTPEETSEVTFELKEIGNEVELTLNHRKLASDRERANVSGGWHVHTGILAALLSEATPPPMWAAHSYYETWYRKQLGM